MIDEPAVMAAIDRIWKLEFRHGSGHDGSNIALMREYLRRSAIAAEALGRTGDWPWFDAAARLTLPDVDTRLLPGCVFLDPEPQYCGPGSDPLEDKIIALSQHTSSRPDYPSLYMWDSCLWYIRWESVKNHPALAPLGLLDLYEPLIVLYERSGWFRMEHAYIDVDGVLIGQGNPRKAAQSEPLSSLDFKELDLLDEVRERKTW